MSSNLLEKRPSFSTIISTSGYQKMINNAIKDPNRVRRFVSSIISAVAVNPTLQECTPSTILSGALLGESLNLSPSPQLGQYYLVPYEVTVKDGNGKTVWILDEQGNHVKDKNGKWLAKTVKNAQYQMGYKGYIQLALRSGYYKKLNVVSIKEGELDFWNPITEDFSVTPISDANERENAKTIGYLAMFEYLNGFQKVIYWSKEKMLAHADRYSPAFSKDAKKGKVSFADYEAGNYPAEESWKYSSFWYKDFDAMAHKTMLRQLISKWGVMSTELQTAFEADETIVMENGDFIRVEEEQNTPEAKIVDVSSTAPEQAPIFEKQKSVEPEQVNLDEL